MAKSRGISDPFEQRSKTNLSTPIHHTPATDSRSAMHDDRGGVAAFVSQTTVAAAPFFKVPLEIRQVIYHMVFLQTKNHCGWCGVYHDVDSVERGPGKLKIGGRRANVCVLDAHDPYRYGATSPRYGFVPTILQVSQQIRLEAAAFYYKKNSFTVEVIDGDLNPFYAWIAVLAEHSKLVRRIKLRFYGNMAWSDVMRFQRKAGRHLSNVDVLAVDGAYPAATYFEQAWAMLNHLKSCGLSNTDLPTAMSFAENMAWSTRQGECEACLDRGESEGDFDEWDGFEGDRDFVVAKSWEQTEKTCQLYHRDDTASDEE